MREMSSSKNISAFETVQTSSLTVALCITKAFDEKCLSQNLVESFLIKDASAKYRLIIMILRRSKSQF